MSSFEKLIKAIKKGDTQKTKQLICDPTLNPNSLDPKTGKSLLQIAMENEDERIFQVISSYPGLDFQIVNRDGISPLQIAIILNQPYFVTKLLQKHINPKKINYQGQTALQVAIKNQTNIQIIKKLIIYNFDINQKLQNQGSLLNLSIISNQLQNFNFLINYPTIKIIQRDNKQNTCLMLGVIHKRGQIVQIILKKIQNDILSDIQKQFFINAQNYQGNTALHLAYKYDYQTIADLIEKQGANLGLDRTIRNSKGLTVDDVRQAIQKDKQMEKEMEKRKNQEKKIKQKQREQQKIRIKKQEQRIKIEEKKKKKLLQAAIQESVKEKKQQSFKKSLFLFVLLFIIALAVMYLVIVGAIEKQKFKKASI